MTTFAGKTAIVTGAASGIGREIAKQLAEAGAHVLATDLPGKDAAFPLDVTKPEDIQAAVDTVVAEHGRLDYMFNNAGVAIFGEFEEVSLAEWDITIDVNLRGVAHGTKIAYDQMVKQGGGGHIIATASVAGLVPVPLQVHYCATKHAVIGMSKTLAVEARRHGITVTAFCPAFVESGMFDDNTMHGSLTGVDGRTLVPIKPLATDKAVSRLLDGVEKRKPLIITPFYGKLGFWLERFFPTLAAHLHSFTLKETRRRAKRATAGGAP